MCTHVQGFPRPGLFPYHNWEFCYTRMQGTPTHCSCEVCIPVPRLGPLLHPRCRAPTLSWLFLPVACTAPAPEHIRTGTRLWLCVCPHFRPYKQVWEACLELIQTHVPPQHRARPRAEPEVAYPVPPHHVDEVDDSPRALVEHEVLAIKYRCQARVLDSCALRAPAALLAQLVRKVPALTY